MTTLLVRQDEAEQLGSTPDTMTLLADVSQTGGHLSTNRGTLGRGRDGATPHFHTSSAEMFFLLDGELEVLNGEDGVTVRTGDMLFVPPHTNHAFGARARRGAAAERARVGGGGGWGRGLPSRPPPRPRAARALPVARPAPRGGGGGGGAPADAGPVRHPLGGQRGLSAEQPTADFQPPA